MAIQPVVGNLTLGSIKAMAIQLENCIIPDNTSHRLLRVPLHEDENGRPDYQEPHVYFTSELIQEKSSSQKVKLNCLSFIEQTSLSSGFVGQWFESYAHSHLQSASIMVIDDS